MTTSRPTNSKTNARAAQVNAWVQFKLAAAFTGIAALVFGIVILILDLPFILVSVIGNLHIGTLIIDIVDWIGFLPEH